MELSATYEASMQHKRRESVSSEEAKGSAPPRVDFPVLLDRETGSSFLEVFLYGAEHVRTKDVSQWIGGPSRCVGVEDPSLEPNEHLLVCRYVDTGKEVPLKGHYRLCYTCYGQEHIPLCLICVQVCHQGHDLSTVQDSARNRPNKYPPGTFHCGCGVNMHPSSKPCKCKALKLAPKRAKDRSSHMSRPFIPTHESMSERDQSLAARNGDVVQYLARDMKRVFEVEYLDPSITSLRVQAAKLVTYQLGRVCSLMSDEQHRELLGNSHNREPTTFASEIFLQYLSDAASDLSSTHDFWRTLDRVISKDRFGPLTVATTPTEHSYYERISQICNTFCSNFSSSLSDDVNRVRVNQCKLFLGLGTIEYTLQAVVFLLRQCQQVPSLAFGTFLEAWEAAISKQRKRWLTGETSEHFTTIASKALVVAAQVDSTFDWRVIPSVSKSSSAELVSDSSAPPLVHVGRLGSEDAPETLSGFTQNAPVVSSDSATADPALPGGAASDAPEVVWEYNDVAVWHRIPTVVADSIEKAFQSGKNNWLCPDTSTMYDLQHMLEIDVSASRARRIRRVDRDSRANASPQFFCEGQGINPRTAVSPDGEYLFVLSSKYGLLKLGTGKSLSSVGKLYAQNRQLFVHAHGHLCVIPSLTADVPPLVLIRSPLLDSRRLIVVRSDTLVISNRRLTLETNGTALRFPATYNIEEQDAGLAYRLKLEAIDRSSRLSRMSSERPDRLNSNSEVVASLRHWWFERPITIDHGEDAAVRPVKPRQAQVGDFVDAKDTVGKWCIGKVVEAAADRIFIQYNGWREKWNEWFDRKSDRLRPLFSHTNNQLQAPFLGDGEAFPEFEGLHRGEAAPAALKKKPKKGKQLTVWKEVHIDDALKQQIALLLSSNVNFGSMVEISDHQTLCFEERGFVLYTTQEEADMAEDDEATGAESNDDAASSSDGDSPTVTEEILRLKVVRGACLPLFSDGPMIYSLHSVCKNDGPFISQSSNGSICLSAFHFQL